MYKSIMCDLKTKMLTICLSSKFHSPHSQNTYKTLNQTVGELLRTLMTHFQQISKTITDFFKNLYDGFIERILPSLKESYSQIEKGLMDLFDEVLSAATNFFERLVDSLKKFENEW